MQIRKTVVVGLFLFLLAACGGGAPKSEAAVETAAETAATPLPPTPPPATKTPPPLPTTPPEDTAAPPSPTPQTAETAATETPPSAAEPPAAPLPASVQDVTIPGAAGLEMQATLSLPAGTPPFPGVMLLHMLGSNRQVWAETGLSQQLADSGYAVLALDMRGHGETGGSQDWALAAEDLQLAWDWFAGLDEVDAENTVIVGASIGANMALITGANVPEIKTVVLLSPGLDYRGVTTEDAIKAYGARPLLIVASQEDGYAADSAQTLSDLAEGEASLIIYDGAGHGTNMFGPQPDLAAALLAWLEEALGD